MEENKSLIGSYITIQGWMLESLGLSGNELLVFALIYSYCRNGGGVYYGSLSLIEKWTNSTKRTAITTLQKLMEKGLIVKRIEKVYGKDNILYDLSPNISPLVKKFHQHGEDFAQDSEKFSPNNINNNNTDNNPPLLLSEVPPRGKGNKTTELDFSFVDPKFGSVVLEWLEYKKERRDKKYGQKGFNKFYADLVKFSNNDPNIAREVIEQSLRNNWAGIFPLKQQNYGNSTSKPTDSQVLKAAIDQSWGPGGDPLADIL